MPHCYTCVSGTCFGPSLHDKFTRLKWGLLYVYDVVVKKFTFAISSPDEFLLLLAIIDCSEESSLFQRGGGGHCSIYVGCPAPYNYYEDAEDAECE